MDKTKVQTALQSRTVRYALLALVAMAAKWLALPLLPTDVSEEVVLLVIGGVDVVISAAVAAAAWFRIKAKKLIEGWV